MSSLTLSVVLLLQFISCGVGFAPPVPEALKQRLDAEGQNLPYYIFLKIWSSLQMDEDVEVCSMVLPADSSFQMFVEPLTKDDIEGAISDAAVEEVLRLATSPYPFQLGNNNSTQGISSFKGATIQKPAHAKTFSGKKLFVWERKGKLVANGAEILEQEDIGDNCALIVARSFPFTRPHEFFSNIEADLGAVAQKAYPKVS